MDVLNKIKKLQEEKGWTMYKLSQESGIPQSTLSNMFIRKTNPSLETLLAICVAFDITLRDFFQDDSSPCNLSVNEQKLIKDFRKLNPNQQKALLDFIDNIK